MIAVMQRVARAAVDVAEPRHHAAIGRGLLVLLGVVGGDDERVASEMAHRIALMRIFPDDAGRMNRSLLDIGGELLLVSQFTLAADCSRGHRPSFVRAARPDIGRTLYEMVGRELADRHGVPVAYGSFGASMQVTLTNDGPVTIILERAAR